MMLWNDSTRNTGRPLLAIAAALGVALVVALPASASDSLALDTGPTSGQGYYTSAPTFSPASETFVATASGALTRVSVLMNKRAFDWDTYQDICATYDWQPLTVQLHPAAADNASIDLGTVLASAQIQPRDVACTRDARGDGYPPVDVVFSQPATLAAGSHYALTFLDNNYSSNPAPGIYQLALGLNSYAGGDFWSGDTRYDFPGYSYDLVLQGFVGAADSTPPNLNVSHTGDGPSGWNTNAAVSLSISASDSGSGLAGAPSCTDNASPLSVTGSAPSFAAIATGQGPHAISCSVRDNAGNQATAGDTVMIDSLGPLATLLGPTDGGSYTLGAVPSASCSTSDPGASASPATGSGVATSASRSVSGATANGVGSFTATCSGATDVAGNTQGNVAKASYKVGYASGGFLSPVNNAPTVNTGKAGRTYPVKWQLRDANGNFISSLSAVLSIGYKAASCSSFSTDPTDALEQSTTGGTALRYDTTAHQYVYNWATPAKGCYTLSLTLDSGQVYRAYFNLS